MVARMRLGICGVCGWSMLKVVMSVELVNSEEQKEKLITENRE
jgi:hypothetical protein